MKKTNLASIGLGILLASTSGISVAATGDASATAATTSSHKIYLKSNQKFLEDTINKLRLVDAVKRVVPKKSSIVLRNIEEEGTTDKKITALVEDQLISLLVSNGYIILERDENAIRRTLEEKSSNKYFSIISKEISGDNSTDIKVKANKKVGSNSIQIGELSIDDGSRHMVKTHMLGASYIINYRIQELGINYIEEDIFSQIPAVDNMSTRSSIARIHIRIQKASSGQVLLAQSLTSTKADTLNEMDKRQLSQYKYSQFYNGYPTNNPDEDNIHTYYNRRGYIEYGLVSSQTTASRLIIGMRTGDIGIGYEVTSLTVTEEIGGTEQELSNDFSLLVINKRFNKVDTDYGKFFGVYEFGIGSADMNLEDNGAIKSEDGLAAKAGIGLEMELVHNISAKIGIDVYAGGSGVVENAFASVTYKFD